MRESYAWGAEYCFSGRSTGDGGTRILFHGMDRGTGNTTVTGFG